MSPDVPHIESFYKRKSVDVQPREPCQWVDKEIGNPIQRWWNTELIVLHVNHDGKLEIMHVDADSEDIDRDEVI